MSVIRRVDRSSIDHMDNVDIVAAAPDAIIADVADDYCLFAIRCYDAAIAPSLMPYAVY